MVATSHSNALRAFHNFVFPHLVISNLPDHFAVIIALKQHEKSNQTMRPSTATLDLSCKVSKNFLHTAHIHPGASSHSNALRAFPNFVFPHLVISNLPDHFAVIIALKQHEKSNQTMRPSTATLDLSCKVSKNFLHTAHIHPGASSHSNALRAFHNFVFPHLAISNLPDHFAVIIALKQHEKSNQTMRHSTDPLDLSCKGFKNLPPHDTHTSWCKFSFQRSQSFS